MSQNMSTMKNLLFSRHYDLVTPDGYIRKLSILNNSEAEAEVVIENISSYFVGFDLPEEKLTFNFKSTLAQLGLDGIGEKFYLDKAHNRAEVLVHLYAHGPLAERMLSKLKPSAYIGKVFAADDRRKVRDEDYLTRMFNRFDREGRPLLLFGGKNSKETLEFDKIDGRLVAFVELKQGKTTYEDSVFGLIDTFANALQKNIALRDFVRLHQKWEEGASRVVHPQEILLVRTQPLHIRTLFAKVVTELLPKGFFHTQADILEPHTRDSGDIYEFFGNSSETITKIPLEFYTLEPYREYVFFSDRDQLQKTLEDPEQVFNFFKNAPPEKEKKASIFIVKGSQLQRTKKEDWVVRTPLYRDFTGIMDDKKYAATVERYIEEQPCYPFLQAIENELITSQGVLFTRYLPTPLMKSMLLSFYVRSLLKRIYFQYPSYSHGYYFSEQDRSMLNDLHSFGISVYWADETSHSLLRYVKRPLKHSGMFVPLAQVKTFQKATFFGVYGSNLLEGNFEYELKKMLKDLLERKDRFSYPLFNIDTPVALVTGGGPGAMEVGNRIAKELNILSCAHVVDFSRPNEIIHEQIQNPYVEAKMTYRLDQLIERQALFYLDFPIFVMGGIGTDFELSLEELRYKVGARALGPVILFGKPEYWKDKITSRFQRNRATGTIKGSEWLSNSFFCIQNAEQGIKVFTDFFEGKLLIGDKHPIYDEGFVIVS